LDKFLKTNNSTALSNGLEIVDVEEEEPAIGNSEEEQGGNVDPNVDDNNVSGPENPTNLSGATQSANTDEPLFILTIFMIQKIEIGLIVMQEIY
jgi:hypothetical protein